MNKGKKWIRNLLNVEPVMTEEEANKMFPQGYTESPYVDWRGRTHEDFVYIEPKEMT